MPKLSRRGFLGVSAATLSARFLPQFARPGGRRVLTLVYDKSIGAMRAVDRWVP